MKDDEIDRRLRAYADRWGVAQPPPPTLDLRRIRSRASHSGLAAVGAAAAVLVVVGGAALLLPGRVQSLPAPAATPTPTASSTGSPRPEVDMSTGVAIPSPQSSSPAPKRCGPVKVRPTYLPWLEEAEPVPPPNIYYGPPAPGPNTATVGWRAPSDRFPKLYYVNLSRINDPFGAGTGEEVPALLFGEKGRFYESPVEGDVAILWATHGHCNTVALRLVTSERMTNAEARREVIRIAQSLQ